MQTAISSILKSANRKSGERLNILSWATHERTDTNISKTGHNFYMFQGQGLKSWETKYGYPPENIILLNPNLSIENQIPKHVHFDLILSQMKFGQIQMALQLARKFHLPLISFEHTCRQPGWTDDFILQLKELRGDINLFITDWSAQNWLWKPGEYEIIRHGVDGNVFRPINNRFGAFPSYQINKEKYVLSICNDFINRDIPCGFSLWKEVTKDLPRKVLGHTPGLSEAAKSIDDLVFHYNQASVFLNTSQYSPIPTVALEAAACGSAIVSTDNCAIKEFFVHGENALLSNDPKELNQFCKDLLENPKECLRLGDNAAATMRDKFSIEAYTKNWNNALQKAAKIGYTGKYS